MSIIYDALRKTQEKIIRIDEKPQGRKTKKKLLFAVFLFVVLLAAFLYSNNFASLNKVNKLGASDKSNSKKFINMVPGLYGSIKEVAKKDEFILNGIAYDNNKTWALINNEILKEGDSVNRAKVTKISQGEVELTLSDDKKLLLTSN